MHSDHIHASGDRQKGVSLIVVMLLLVIASILGAGAAQIATMGERSTRNERDTQIAWQSAEAALMDAEYDIHGTTPASGTARTTLFANMQSTSDFRNPCGATGSNLGLCALAETGQPAWLKADLTATSGSSLGSAEFGHFTGRSFAAKASPGDAGILPAKKPRYVIEPIADPLNRDKSISATPTYIYRVTAMGFGPREDIQAVSQILYRN